MVIIVVNVIVTILIFIILFVATLTFGVVVVYLYIKALAKLFDWIDRKIK
nr:MAG TPA: hypothetical protein [Caudoviricetes sp.]